MNKYDNTTSVLSVSKKIQDTSAKRWENCAKVISILKAQKIISSVVPNKSIQCDNSKRMNKCWIEWGCRITTPLKPEYIKSDLWIPLKKELNLNCAHLWIHGKYRGCVNSYRHKSRSNKEKLDACEIAAFMN